MKTGSFCLVWFLANSLHPPCRDKRHAKFMMLKGLISNFIPPNSWLIPILEIRGRDVGEVEGEFWVRDEFTFWPHM
jgi:hypothetical protein